MDGRSQVTVVVLGQQGVGKTSFLLHCLADSPAAAVLSRQAKISICGRVIKIRMVDNPSRNDLVPAIIVILLFDLTNEDSFRHLGETMELAQRISPMALRAVVGTKADLPADQRRVSIEEALAFCQQHSSGSSNPIPYYETGLQPSDSIAVAFHEILARPLINDYVIRATTELEQTTFVHEVMEWSISNGSANILTHLRDLGYSLPEQLVERHPTIICDYLLGEYPLRVVPRSTKLELLEPALRSLDEEDELEDYEDEPLTVHDNRPTLQVTRTYHLAWGDISLPLFHTAFLDSPSIPLAMLTHIDLSCNNLLSVPVQFFQLTNVESINVSRNQITSLPSIELWNPATHLQVLNVSHNNLSAGSHSPLLFRKHGSTGVSVPFQHLWYLDLSHNRLPCFPQYILHFPLHHLNLSHNPKITSLPVGICQLQKLSCLLLEGLSLVDPPPFVARHGPQAVVDYLRQKKRASLEWSSMRVALIGPRDAGKSTLVAKLKGDNWANSIGPTKGLEVVEWRYRGGDLLAFRNKYYTLDLWDFSGDPDYRSIYSCFNCSNCLHLVVCNATQGTRDLARWLSDIQAVSTERLAVIVVFTHMDKLHPRERKEEFRRQTTQWLDYHNNQGDSSNGAFSLMSSMSQSVRSLQGEDMLSSYEPPQEVFDMQELCGEVIPLMPLVIKAHFVSSTTGENIPSLRKTLYRVASGAYHHHLVGGFHGFRLIGQLVPTVYCQVEYLMRQLRQRFHSSRREGEQKAFYSLTELQEKLRRQLSELRIDRTALVEGLKFLHEVGSVYVHSTQSQLLVGVDPQLIGYLLQRMIRAGLVTKEVDKTNCCLPNSHLAMLWGLEPVWSLEQEVDTVMSEHLLSFLHSLRMCSPIFPGATLMTSLLPPALPREKEPDTSKLVPRRSYILSYLPSTFTTQLISLVVTSLVDSQSESFRSMSPGQLATPTNTIPLVAPSGSKFYLWQRNVIMVDREGSKLWLRVREGKQVGPDSVPFCGRLDLLIEAGLETEALWIRTISQQVDFLLQSVFPALLDSEQSGQHVEVFIPLGSEWPSRSDGAEESSQGEDGSRLAGDELAAVASGNTLHPLVVKSSDLSCSPSQVSETSSWEIIARESTTSTRLSVIPDAVSSDYLVPLWECLQEAFKTPVIRVNNSRLVLRKVLPDLLFADLPPELMYRTSLNPPDQDLFPHDDTEFDRTLSESGSGLFVRSYFTSEDADQCVRKPAGALKTYCLQRCLSRLRSDFLKLRSLQCPYLVAPLGVNFCPPCLALESPPYGSLATKLRTEGRHIGRELIHHISLQLMHALEFFHSRGLCYHSIDSSNVLIWNLDPVSIKLSDTGITHPADSCELCLYLSTLLDPKERQRVMARVDYMALGLLEFEMATGKRAYDGIYKLHTVILALLRGKMTLNIGAQNFIRTAQENDFAEFRNFVAEIGENPSATGCQKLCLQSTMAECIIHNAPIRVPELAARFSLCAGDCNWTPLRLLVNVESMICSEDGTMVYWASGSRGLVTGTLEPANGNLNCNILQEAPPPGSGMFANRRGKPVPIAVGRATALSLVQATNQLWVGTENGPVGSVYVFNLPDMRRHHHIHLQDAVLSLCAINSMAVSFGVGELMKYRVLVGLANGTIILFLGIHQGKVLENPLQGPKLVVLTHKRKPCLTMTFTPDGNVWCSCGDIMEVFDISTLKSIRRMTTQLALQQQGGGEGAVGGGARGVVKGDVIALMVVNARGVWTVSRRSGILRLWDLVSGQLQASFNVCNVMGYEQDHITALAIQGGALWLGTRAGNIFILDQAKMAAGQEPLLGLQYCGDGKVKCIVPIMPWRGAVSRLQVLCSVEFPDEVSGALLTWEYLTGHVPWRRRGAMERCISMPPPTTTASCDLASLDITQQCKSL